MPSVQGTKLDSMMRKITSLLARADHPNTPEPEADSSRAMAEKLMRKYRIEESELIASGDMLADTITPVSREVPVCPSDSKFMTAYYNLMLKVMHHCGVRGKNSWKGDEQGILHLTMVMVGYESDLRFTEAIYQNARMVFADRMEPKPSAKMSDLDNVYKMRSAGMERIRIAALMGWGTTNSATSKVTRLYKKACAERDEDATLTGRNMNVGAFRDSYVTGFLTEFNSRLRNALRAADGVGGGELVLANRTEYVDEAFYRLYPEMRPSGLPALRSQASRKWSKADYARWDRQNSVAGRAGSNAGKQAAQEVQVSGSRGASRLES